MIAVPTAHVPLEELKISGCIHYFIYGEYLLIEVVLTSTKGTTITYVRIYSTLLPNSLPLQGDAIRLPCPYRGYNLKSIGYACNSLLFTQLLLINTQRKTKHLFNADVYTALNTWSKQTFHMGTLL